MKKLALALTIFLVPTLLSAQILSRTRTFSQLGTCSKDGEIKIITDASVAGVCAAGGTSLAACWCDLGTTTWISQPVASSTLDLSAYVPVTKAGYQTITSTGGDASTKVQASSSTNAFEAVVEVIAGESWSGAILDAKNADGESRAYAQFNSSASSVRFDAAGLADEIVITEGVTTINGLARLTPTATPPVACDSEVEGGLYIDSDTHLFCGCNGTAWVQIADGTTGCS